MKKVYFKTFGCRTNLFDTQVMKQSLLDFECTLDENAADIIVINSCTVTNDADIVARSYARKMHSFGKEIFFTGCGVKNIGKQLYDMGIARATFGHSQKENINIFLKENRRFFHYEPPTNAHIDSALVSDFHGKVRAFIKIQEGCNFRCSYCIIPSVRGVSRSYDDDKIISEIRLLVQNGVKEVVLTGTNVGSYGRDVGKNISDLIIRISQVRGLKRVRIGSLEPSQIDDKFLDVLNLDVLEKHMHIALQHTHDKMLSKMNRINRYKHDEKLLNIIADKGFAIGTDLIIGHPGESENIYNEALVNLKNLPITHVHPFIYSKRTGTKSASMEQSISKKAAKKRLHEIKDIVAKNNENFRKNMRKNTLYVLCEKGESFSDIQDLAMHENTHTNMKIYSGFCQYFNKIKIVSDGDFANKWIEVNDYEIRPDFNYAQV